MRTSALSARDAAQTTAALLAVLGLGALAWGLALLGVFSLTGQSPGPAAAGSTLAGALPVGLDGLPEYPGAVPAEFREEIFGDERVIEIEYQVASSVADVRAHYRDAIARGDWTLGDATWLYGEWQYTASRGAHHATVEIEATDGLTEVEIELTEPAAARSLLARP